LNEVQGYNYASADSIMQSVKLIAFEYVAVNCALVNRNYKTCPKIHLEAAQQDQLAMTVSASLITNIVFSVLGLGFDSLLIAAKGAQPKNAVYSAPHEFV
jgi:hypothetical protein